MSGSGVFQGITKKAEGISLLPSAIPRTRFEKTCAIARVNEVLAICRNQGLNPHQIIVTCTPALAKKIGLLAPIDGISVQLSSNSKRLDEDDCGSFSVEISGFCCASELTISATGIAYSSPVDLRLHEMRWIFQVVDGMRPEDAQQSAKRLYK